MRSQTNLGLRKWCTDGDTFFLSFTVCSVVESREFCGAGAPGASRTVGRVVFVKVTFFVIIKLERSLKVLSYQYRLIQLRRNVFLFVSV